MLYRNRESGQGLVVYALILGLCAALLAYVIVPFFTQDHLSQRIVEKVWVVVDGKIDPTSTYHVMFQGDTRDYVVEKATYDQLEVGQTYWITATWDGTIKSASQFVPGSG